MVWSPIPRKETPVNHLDQLLNGGTTNPVVKA
jgi:hypothetical protein